MFLFSATHHELLLVRTVGTARKPPLQGSSFKSAMKQVSRDVEALETDPEDVTDEMMETAYFRLAESVDICGELLGFYWKINVINMFWGENWKC